MNSSHSAVSPASLPAFLRHQGKRAGLRLRTFAFGARATLIWTLVIVACSWLVHAGWTAVAVGLLAVWVLITLPALLLDLLLAVDLLGYVARRRIVVFPFFHALYEAYRDSAADQPVPDGVRFLSRLAWLGTSSSPFSALSFWCFVVLARLPVSCHEPVPADVIANAVRVGRGEGMPKQIQPPRGAPARRGSRMLRNPLFAYWMNLERNQWGRSYVPA